MKTILITGVAGFIGSNLAQYLVSKEKYRIIGIDNLSYGLIEQVPKEIDFHKIDIRDKSIQSLFRNVDCVFHLAAKNCISDCQSDPDETIDINIKGSINIFKASVENNVNRIIYSDSSAVYEGSTLLPTPESEVYPISNYAISKQTGENFLKSITAQQFTDYTSLRYFNVYGPRQDYRRSIPPLMSSMIIKMLNKERPVIYGNGSKKRDFIHINDINRFHEILINKKNINQKIFNLGSGNNFSVNEIFIKIRDLLRLSVEPIYMEDLPGEAQENLADINRAIQLNWFPQVTLDDGLLDMIRYIKKNVIKE